jgi:hypothetical protein
VLIFPARKFYLLGMNCVGTNRNGDEHVGAELGTRKWGRTATGRTARGRTGLTPLLGYLLDSFRADSFHSIRFGTSIRFTFLDSFYLPRFVSLYLDSFPFTSIRFGTSIRFTFLDSFYLPRFVFPLPRFVSLYPDSFYPTPILTYPIGSISFYTTHSIILYANLL